MERHIIVVGDCPVAHLTHETVGITNTLNAFQTPREKLYREEGGIMVEADNICLFVEQTIADGNLTDDKITVFVLRCHQLAGIDTHVPFGASHEYLTLW